LTPDFVQSLLMRMPSLSREIGSVMDSRRQVAQLARRGTTERKRRPPSALKTVYVPAAATAGSAPAPSAAETVEGSATSVPDNHAATGSVPRDGAPGPNGPQPDGRETS